MKNVFSEDIRTCIVITPTEFEDILYEIYPEFDIGDIGVRFNNCEITYNPPKDSEVWFGLTMFGKLERYFGVRRVDHIMLSPDRLVWIAFTE